MASPILKGKENIIYPLNQICIFTGIVWLKPTKSRIILTHEPMGYPNLVSLLYPDTYNKVQCNQLCSEVCSSDERLQRAYLSALPTLPIRWT